MKKNLPFKTKFILLAGLFLFITGGWIMLAWQKENDSTLTINKNDYVRLHILANSDNLEDQRLKLKVRDAVVAYLTPLVKETNNSKEAKEIIIGLKENILDVARKAIAESGGNYPVTMEIGNFDFPVRTYGALVLPEGNYQAVRLSIGKGVGENWWCVLFPPLCFIDGSAAQTNPLVKKENPKDSKELLEQEKDPKIEIRWKIVGLFNK